MYDVDDIKSTLTCVEMGQPLSGKTRESLRSIAHKLKGVSHTIGLYRLHHAALELHQAFHAGNTEVSGLVKALADTLQLTLDEINTIISRT